MIAVLFGPPGVGKGTQAHFVSRTFGLPHVATGDMLRAEVGRGTPLGREVGPIMSSGALVPDDLIVRVIEERLRHADARRGLLLDGFPRTVPQAEALTRMLEGQGRTVDLVLCMDAPSDVLVERLLGRAAEEGRSDDTPETIRRRLAVYGESTAPVMEWYRTMGARVVTVDGAGTVDEVRARIRDVFASAGVSAEATR